MQKNVARLADYGWSFDLQVFAGQMKGAAELAASAPKVTFILQHAGMLEDLSAAGWEQWRAGMRELAAGPNVVSSSPDSAPSSIRTIPTISRRWCARPSAFSVPERCLFGSNFPVEKLWTRYADLVAAYRARSNRSAKAARAALHDTAARVYRLN